MKDELNRAKELAKAHAEGVNTAMRPYLLTKRELFAMAAMQGLLANSNIISMSATMSPDKESSMLERYAVMRADTLLEALEK